MPNFFKEQKKEIRQKKNRARPATHLGQAKLALDGTRWCKFPGRSSHNDQNGSTPRGHDYVPLVGTPRQRSPAGSSNWAE